MVPEKSEDASKIMALIILSFLMIGLPGLTICFGALVLYAVYNWYLLLRSAPDGNAIMTLFTSLLSLTSFYALRALITWLRK